MTKLPHSPASLRAAIDDGERLRRALEPTFSFWDQHNASIERILGRDVDGAAAMQQLYRDVFPQSYFEPAAATSVTSLAAQLQSEIEQLQQDVRQKTAALKAQAADSHGKDQEIASLRDDLLAIHAKQRIAHLLNRVGSTAQERLVTDEDLRARFQSTEACNAYVMSVDVRRSTELMLKAREPRLFADFMVTLVTGLRRLIVDDYGVFDKFTGDGMLAFFPEFFSGDDAGFRAVRSAMRCHTLFADHYKAHRSSFKSILLDTGLGIGIDYGATQMIELGGEFTVVGEPVVYACRMSGAEAGSTYLNQPAFDQLFPKYASFDFTETQISIKHEGQTLAYSVRANGKPFSPSIPPWAASTTNAASE